MALSVGSGEDFFGDDVLDFLGGTQMDGSFSDAETEAFFNSLPEELFAVPTSGKEPHPLPHPSTSAFASATVADLRRFKDKNKNKNTQHSTDTWVRRFQAWQNERSLSVSIATIEPQELDGILQRFFAEIRKADGTEYEPESLRTMLGALDRHFREEGYKYRILKDREFEASRKIHGHAIELRERGKGKRTKRADPLVEEEEEILWKSGVLGGDNPQSLNYTVFYVVSQHFGTRGCQEHHQIRLEHLKLVKNAEGHSEYIEWIEGLTKTRQGGLSKRDRRVPQRVFATGGSRCPLMFLEKLISKRPPCLQHSGPLYLRPLKKISPTSATWFSSQPVGVNTINGYMKEMAKFAGLEATNKRFTNHSVRKTTVRKLQKGGVSNDKITAITGHKNEQSLREYADTDLEDHRKMSALLSKHPLQDTTNVMPIVPWGSSDVPLCGCPALPSQQPAYSFNNCNVYINSTLTHGTSMNSLSMCRKRQAIIESDSDSDS